jgi:hypothetical protein
VIGFTLFLKLELILSREGLRCSIGQFEKEYLEAPSLNAKLRALRAAMKTREEEVTLLILRAGHNRFWCKRR